MLDFAFFAVAQFDLDFYFWLVRTWRFTNWRSWRTHWLLYWLFGFASKKYHPLEHFDKKRWEDRGIKTWYYTANLHVGAFMLPRYVEDLLEEEENS